MAQGNPRPVQGLSRSRAALLGVYAAYDPELERELRYLGVDFPEPLDAYAQLRAAAEERPDEQDRPRIHGLHLAFAAMFVLGAAPRADFREQLDPVAGRLIDPDLPPETRDDAIRTVLDALERVARAEVAIEDRWAQVVEEAGRYLHPELRIIETAWCRPELREVDGEFVSRIETMLVVRDQRTLDQLALAVLPQNWKKCNDFFCDLTRVAERDADCPGFTGGSLSPAATHWRGVYEERVGSCPRGWFPDTYLLFTWDRSVHQLILRYELAPRRKNDKTVLKVARAWPRRPARWVGSTTRSTKSPSAPRISFPTGAPSPIPNRRRASTPSCSGCSIAATPISWRQPSPPTRNSAGSWPSCARAATVPTTGSKTGRRWWGVRSGTGLGHCAARSTSSCSLSTWRANSHAGEVRARERAPSAHRLKAASVAPLRGSGTGGGCGVEVVQRCGGLRETPG